MNTNCMNIRQTHAHAHAHAIQRCRVMMGTPTEVHQNTAIAHYCCTYVVNDFILLLIFCFFNFKRVFIVIISKHLPLRDTHRPPLPAVSQLLRQRRHDHVHLARRQQLHVLLRADRVHGACTQVPTAIDPVRDLRKCTGQSGGALTNASAERRSGERLRQLARSLQTRPDRYHKRDENVNNCFAFERGAVRLQGSHKDLPEGRAVRCVHR